MNTTLDSASVQDALWYCFYTDEELETLPKDEAGVPEGCVFVKSVIIHAGLHAGRVAEKKKQVRAWLAELPDQFKRSNGQGWSFLEACMDKHGRQWGEHRDVDALLCLGLATKQVRYILDSDGNRFCMGGMPYFVVMDE